MSRIVCVAAVILVILGSSAAAAQEESADTPRLFGSLRNGVGSLSSAAQKQARELERKAGVLGLLAEAADMVSPMAMGQTLAHARQKVDDARREAEREPALGEPVPAVVQIVSQYVTTPPFGMPADQLRARLFVEISKLEEDILRQSEALESEANAAESIAQSLQSIQGRLHAAAVAGGRMSLQVRKLALGVRR